MAQESLPKLVQKAEQAYQSGQFTESAELFQQAASQYSEESNALKAAEMLNNRSVALLRAGNVQGALEASAGTDQVFAQAGDTRRQALALGNQAAALEEANRLDEALTRYWDCSNLLKQIGDEETRVPILKSISALQIRTGRQLEALASMDTALSHKKKLTVQERFLKKLLDVPMRMLRRS